MNSLYFRLKGIQELAPFALLTMLGMVIFVYGAIDSDAWIALVGAAVALQSVCYGLWLAERQNANQ